MITAFEWVLIVIIGLIMAAAAVFGYRQMTTKSTCLAAGYAEYNV